MFAEILEIDARSNGSCPSRSSCIVPRRTAADSVAEDLHVHPLVEEDAGNATKLKQIETTTIYFTLRAGGEESCKV